MLDPELYHLKAGGSDSPWLGSQATPLLSSPRSVKWSKSPLSVVRAEDSLAPHPGPEYPHSHPSILPCMGSPGSSGGGVQLPSSVLSVHPHPRTYSVPLLSCSWQAVTVLMNRPQFVYLSSGDRKVWLTGSVSTGLSVDMAGYKERVQLLWLVAQSLCGCSGLGQSWMTPCWVAFPPCSLASCCLPW